MAAILPSWTSSYERIFKEMGIALPTATQVLISLKSPIVLVGVGLMMVALIAKEFHTPLKVRLCINVANLVILLGFCAFCVVAVRLSILSIMRAMQGQ